MVVVVVIQQHHAMVSFVIRNALRNTTISTLETEQCVDPFWGPHMEGRATHGARKLHQKAQYRRHLPWSFQLFNRKKKLDRDIHVKSFRLIMPAILISPPARRKPVLLI
jgi:hypothetical protein